MSLASPALGVSRVGRTRPSIFPSSSRLHSTLCKTTALGSSSPRSRRSVRYPLDPSPDSAHALSNSLPIDARKYRKVAVRSAASDAVKSADASDEPQYSQAFKIRRLLVFASIVIGYACYYLTRNSLTYTAPSMVATPGLGIDITQVGVMTSIFPLAYGFSKFVAGVLSARLSPTVMLAGGLMATALVNIAFGFGTSLAWFSVCWGLNGILQGTGGPSCARILTNWFATKERGTYWGLWNISHNMGGFLAPIIAGTAARSMGWQWGMWAPGIIGLVLGFVILFGVKDSPESLGFPPVEDPAAREKAAKEKAAAKGAPAAGEKVDVIQILVQTVLKNPYIWGLAITYFFVYVVRQGVTSWFIFYLIKEKAIENAAEAALRVSGLELGGLFGSLLAGKLSDAMITRNPAMGAVGARIRVVMGYTVGVAACLAAFIAVPVSIAPLQWFTVFMIGFFLYGPQMLIGLCGAEIVGPKSVGASEGLLGWIAYLGAANAGVPLSIIVRDYGWSSYFTTLFVSCGMVLLLLTPMINLKSFVQREKSRLKKEAAAAAALAPPSTGGEGGAPATGMSVSSA